MREVKETLMFDEGISAHQFSLNDKYMQVERTPRESRCEQTSPIRFKSEND